MSTDQTKQCKFCKETILQEAFICRYCRKDQRAELTPVAKPVNIPFCLLKIGLCFVFPPLAMLLNGGCFTFILVSVVSYYCWPAAIGMSVVFIILDMIEKSKK